MRFCKKCGSGLPPGSILCRRCGNTVLYEDRDGFLSFMEGLLSRERSEERRKVIRDKVEGKVVDVGGGAVTIECRLPRFEEGDIVGYVVRDAVEPLGVVLGGGRILTVEPYKKRELEEGQSLELCEVEVLVGYDLQLDLIRKIKKEEMGEFEKNVVSHVFENHDFQSLRRVKPSDVFDVRDRFPLDDSQLEAVECALGLQDGELLLIIAEKLNHIYLKLRTLIYYW